MIYAASSSLVALKVRRDTFYHEALDSHAVQQDEAWAGSPSQSTSVPVSAASAWRVRSKERLARIFHTL
jgi:hypothetical protein